MKTTDKILFQPKEGTSWFWGLRDVPEEPNWNLTSLSNDLKKGKYREALESCKSNSLEIVNPEVSIPECDQCDGCGWFEGGPTLKTKCSSCKGTGLLPKDFIVLKSGELFDLPIGYEFKEEEMCGSDVCQENGQCEHCREPKRVLRLVKTETKEDNWNEADEQYLKSIDHHPIAVMYIRSLRDQITQLKKQVPQPEPEESQDELWDEVEDILTNPKKAALDITHYFTVQRITPKQ